MLFAFDLEEVGLVPRFLQVLLVLVFELYIILHLAFDEFMLIGECLLQ